MSALVVRNLSEEALAEIERLAEQNGIDAAEQAGRMLCDLVNADPPDPLPEVTEAELPNPRPKTGAELLAYLDAKYPNADFEGIEFPRLRGGIREVDFG